MAEYTRRPLLSITAADLGHDPVELEKNLLTFFRNANNWRAIVLLDEADIYLERRSTNDLRRNSIVSSMFHFLHANLVLKITADNRFVQSSFALLIISKASCS